MEIDDLTLYWLAGLLEGDGSFCAGLPSNPSKPYIVIKMVDEDIIARVAAIFKVKYHISCPESYETKGWSRVYSARVTGKNAVELMTLLKPLMGKRRQEQIDRALEKYTGDNRRVLDPEKVEELRQRAQNGENMLKLAREFGISKSLAYGIRQGMY